MFPLVKKGKKVEKKPGKFVTQTNHLRIYKYNKHNKALYVL